MSERKGRRHGDLPVTLLNERYDWVLPESHNPDEIEATALAPEGSLMVTREERGINVARHFMGFYAQQEDVGLFGPDRVAEASYASAYYAIGRQSIETPLSKRVGRKRTYLPVHKETKGDISRQSISLDSAKKLAGAAETAGELSYEVMRRGSRVLDKKRSAGLQLANIALLIASMPYATEINEANGPKKGEGDDVYMQELAHMGMERMLKGIQETTVETGVNPRLAQLALVRSPLTMYLDNQGGQQASLALEYAQDMTLDDERWLDRSRA